MNPRPYQVQFRDERDRWRAPRREADHADLESAKKRITICDEDGYFSPNARIMGPDGFTFTFDDWYNGRMDND